MRAVDVDAPVLQCDRDLIALGSNAGWRPSGTNGSSVHPRRRVIEVDLAVLDSGVNHCWPPSGRLSSGGWPGGRILTARNPLGRETTGRLRATVVGLFSDPLLRPYTPWCARPAFSPSLY